MSSDSDDIVLPEPASSGSVSVEEAIAKRRSVRKYSGEPLSLSELSQMLWAAQGVTSQWGGRAAPSAGGTYPLEAYAVVGDVEGASPGVYRYVPGEKTLRLAVDGDVRSELAEAALGQSMISEAPAIIVISAVYERTTGRYGDRGVMYVHMEAGHAGQNIYLQAESLGLGTVAVGAFRPRQVSQILGLPEDEEPIYMYPIGRR
ncbi:MAG: SagB/ThcOx family dehydrogenase [Candidatus Altiarchaeales archaeon]|nr:SagB/ThcOx family dehydrogenase [Candidatus Altiarchaeales archaeon]MBD3417039.1 SagB/ThcOx family dehydrogenase [Candidatus Altiarchaeales archaeon]